MEEHEREKREEMREERRGSFVYALMRVWMSWNDEARDPRENERNESSWVASGLVGQAIPE